MTIIRAMLYCVFVAAPTYAAAHGDLQSEHDHVDYALGYWIGGDLKRDGLAPGSLDILLRGLRDALEGSQPPIAVAEMQATIVELRRKVAAEQQARRQQRLGQHRGEGQAFLEANILKDDIVQLPSGLQYRVSQKGGGRSPGPEDRVTVHYLGTLIDGTVFDSSYARGEPTRVGLGGVIPGWREGLQRMKEGGRYQLFIPPHLAYGDEGKLAGRTLLFDVELISVDTGEPD